MNKIRWIMKKKCDHRTSFEIFSAYLNYKAFYMKIFYVYRSSNETDKYHRIYVLIFDIKFDWSISDKMH